MQRGAVAAELADVEGFRCLEHDRRIRPRPVRHGLEHADALLRRDHLVRGVERQQDRLDAAGQHDGGGVRVAIGVELGRRRDIAHFAPRAQHHHHFGNAGRDIGRLLQGIGQVGQRSQRHDGDRAGLGGAQGVDQELNAGLRLDRQGGDGQVGAVETGLAMHVLGRDQATAHRRLCAGIERHVRPPGQFQQLARIVQRVMQGHIAGDGDDPDDLQVLRRGASQQQRQGIVLAGVGIDNDLLGHRGLRVRVRPVLKRNPAKCQHFSGKLRDKTKNGSADLSLPDRMALRINILAPAMGDQERHQVFVEHPRRGHIDRMAAPRHLDRHDIGQGVRQHPR